MLLSLSPAKNSRQGLGEARPSLRIRGAAHRGPGLPGSGEWREGSGDTRGGGPCVILSSAARSVPTRTWSPSSLRAAQLGPGLRPPEALSRAEGLQGAHQDRGASLSPAGARTLTSTRSGYRLLSRWAQFPRPHRPHGHHFRSRHPAASSPPAALRLPLSLGAPGLRGPGTPSHVTGLGAVLPANWSSHRWSSKKKAATPPGKQPPRGAAAPRRG